MFKIKSIINILAISSLFLAISLVFTLKTSAEPFETLSNILDSVIPASNALIPGFYQFNNLEILKGPVVNEPPATIEVIQKNEKSCVVYENGKNDQPRPCFFKDESDAVYAVQIDERTTLLGTDREPALLIDFEAGDKVNVLGWLSPDLKTIRAAVLRNLEIRKFHQSLSGTIKKVKSDGLILILDGTKEEIFVETPLFEGAQIKITGVFDKINGIVSNVLSVFIKPNIVLREETRKKEPPAAPAAPSAKPGTLFKNFLKVFGL